MRFKDIKSVTDSDTTCGFGYFRMRWMQIFVCKELIVTTLSVFTMVSSSHYFYMYGTLSTIEKLYKLSSRAIASLETSVELGHLVVSFSIAYFVGRGHKARWFAFAVLLCSLASFMEMLPHFIFRTEDYYEYSSSYENQNVLNNTDSCNHQNVLEKSSNYSYYNFLIACFILGIAFGIVRSTGFVYLDDNVSKNQYLFLSCIVSVAGEIGSSSGLIFSSFTLGYFVDLTVPKLINKNDPRWVGAWWLGFIFYGISFLIISFVAVLLPRILPEAAERKKWVNLSLKKHRKLSVRDFATSIKNILTKRIVYLDLCSAVCLSFSGVAYSIFYPKYTEIIFGLSASQSNVLIGYFSVFGRSVAVLSLGICMSKFKPLPRTLIQSSIFLQSLAAVLLSLLLFLGCPQQRIHGHWNTDNSWSLEESCNRNYNCEETKYSPVCQVEEQILYFSSCHAGCNSSSNHNISETPVLSNCSCVPKHQTIINGPCKREDCSSMLFIALVAVTFYQFIGVPINVLRNMMRLRYVEDDEKAFYLSLHKGISMIFSCLARTLYGSVLDYTCLFFSKSCGRTENCWWYNSDQLRYIFNGITIVSAHMGLNFGMYVVGAIILAIIADSFLWSNIHGLKMYDEDSEVIHEDSKNLPAYEKFKSDGKSS